KGRVRIDGTERVSHPHIGISLGERGAGHLYGLLWDAVTGRSGQRHRKPPVGRVDSTGYGTTHARNHTGDVRHWNSVAPWMASIQGLPATSCQHGRAAPPSLTPRSSLSQMAGV